MQASEHGSPLRARDLALVLARMIVGGVLVALSLDKIGAPADFLKAVREYAILPEDPPHLLNLTAVVLPWVELLGGSFLLLGIFRRGTAAVLTAILAVFTAAILVRGLGIQAETGASFCAIAFDCGCGSGVVNLCWKLLENTGLVLLGLTIALARTDRLTLCALRRRQT